MPLSESKSDGMLRYVRISLNQRTFNASLRISISCAILEYRRCRHFLSCANLMVFRRAPQFAFPLEQGSRSLQHFTRIEST
jgi:hypothetical protein